MKDGRLAVWIMAVTFALIVITGLFGCNNDPCNCTNIETIIDTVKVYDTVVIKTYDTMRIEHAGTVQIGSHNTQNVTF